MKKRHGLAMVSAALIALLLTLLALNGNNAADRTLDNEPSAEEAGPELAGRALAVDESIVTDAAHSASPQPVTLIVEDADTRKPVEGARVGITSAGEMFTRSETTRLSGTDGKAELPTSAADEHQVWVLADGYQMWQGAVPGGSEYRVRLLRGGQIQGEVRDESGRRIAGAAVWCSLPQNRCAWPHTDKLFSGALGGGATTSTNTQGNFALLGLADAVYEIRASAPLAVEPAFGLWPRASPGQRDVSVTLRRAWVMAVQVKNTEGRKLPVGVVSFRVRASTAFTNVSEYAVALPQDTRAALLRGQTKIIALVPYRGGVADTGTHKCEIIVTAPGHAPLTIVESIEPGVLVRREVRMEAENKAHQVRLVRFGAHLRDGSAVNGTIVFRWVSESRTSGRLGLTFDNGVASDPIPMPVGRHHLVPEAGASRETCTFWPQQAQPISVDVPNGRGVVQRRLQIDGNVVALSVLSAAATEVRGFDLRVRSDSYPLPWHEEWDAKWNGRELRTGAQKPTFLVPPGQWRVETNMPGLGGASGSVSADGSGRPLSLELMLDPESEYPLRETRQSMSSAYSKK